MCYLTVGGGGLNVRLPIPCNPSSPVPTPSVVVPASLCFFYCKVLRNVAKFFPIFPGYATLGSLPLPFTFTFYLVFIL